MARRTRTRRVEDELVPAWTAVAGKKNNGRMPPLATVTPFRPLHLSRIRIRQFCVKGPPIGDSFWRGGRCKKSPRDLFVNEAC